MLVFCSFKPRFGAMRTHASQGLYPCHRVVIAEARSELISPIRFETGCWLLNRSFGSQSGRIFRFDGRFMTCAMFRNGDSLPSAKWDVRCVSPGTWGALLILGVSSLCSDRNPFHKTEYVGWGTNQIEADGKLERCLLPTLKCRWKAWCLQLSLRRYIG